MVDTKKGRIHTKSACPECGSDNVYLSEYRGMEGVIASFLPRNIFKCVDCNNRFWAYEPLFANSSRVWSLILLFLAVLVVVFVFFQTDDTQTIASRKAEFIPQFDSPNNAVRAEDLLPVEGDKPLSSALSGTDQGLGQPLLDKNGNKKEINGIKNESEQISDTIKSSIDRLESAFIEDQKALVSLLKVDINHAVESWRKSWQSGVVKDYLSHYSDDFKPSNFLPLREWKVERAEVVTPANNIEVTLSDFEVSFDDDNTRATVLFTQSYFSTKFAEVSRKKLELVNENDEWKIVVEREI